MKYRYLGRTGLRVSEVGFGGWGIGRKLWKGGDDREALRALNAAVDLGINFFDTALVYGNGHSEALIGRLIAETGADLLVATKVPPLNRKWPGQGSLREAFPSSQIRECAENSLRNLGMERIQLLQLHVWKSEWTLESEWYDTLSSLREEGKIEHFGVSVNDHDPESALELVKSGRVDTVQVIYHIFDPSPAERLFPTCSSHQVGLIARAPFDEGALTGQVTAATHFSRRDWRSHYFKGDRRRQVEQRIQSLASDLGVDSGDLPEMALRFCLASPEVGCVIPGMRKAEHVRRNAAASGLPALSEEVLRVFERHRWDKNFYQ